MKKSLWIVLLLALICTLALSACDDTNQPQTPNEDHVHAFGEWTTVKDATCTVKGEQERSCSCGEKENKSIDATGHTEVVDAAVDPACNATGLTEGKHCSVCNEPIVVQEVVAKLEHTPTTDAAVAPTCTETGLTEGTHCSVCNEVITKQEIVKANGHTWGVWSQTKAPNCTEKGEERRDCDVCDHYETREVNANGHTNKDAVVENKINETCTADGSYDSVIYCSVCNGEVSREAKILPKLGHDHSTEWTVDIEPNCTEKGSKSHHCSRCSDKADVTEIAANGHTWGVWSQTKAPNCTEKGEERRDCDVCDHYETREVNANGHTESEFVVDVAATIYSEGMQHTYCTVCNSDIQTEVVIPRIVSNGLAYEVNADGATCTITGIGICTDTEIGIPDTIDGYKVTAIGENAFENQITITNIALSNNVETISNRAFYGCTGLNEFTITKNVRTFGTQIFYKANNLKTIYYYSSYSSNVSPFASSSVEHVVLVDVTSLPNIFSGSSVKKVTIPDSVRYIGTQFSGLTSLTDITIGKGVSSIDDEAFTGCVNLENVYYNGTITDWCNIYFSYRSYGGATSYSTEANPMCYADHFYINGIEIKEIIISEGQTNINKFTFYGFNNVTQITLPSTIKTIGCYAFSNCNSLENVFYCGTIADWCSISFGDESSNGGNLSSNPMYYAQHFFIDETELKELVISDTVSVISDRAFCGFENITTVIIPDSITAIGKEVFYHCDNLLSIVMPKSIGVIEASAFSYCKNIDYVYYEGTEDDWSLIGIGSSNSYLQNAIHYYSENQPTSEDNYWHYVDGVPTPW